MLAIALAGEIDSPLTGKRYIIIFDLARATRIDEWLDLVRRSLSISALHVCSRRMNIKCKDTLILLRQL
jgi:hypothetical protein